MEELLLGQARGLLILAYAHEKQGNLRLCLYYLNRAKAELNTIQKMREMYEQKAA